MFFLILTPKDIPFMVGFVIAILRKKEQTVIDLLGSQILQVRFKEIKP